MPSSISSFERTIPAMPWRRLVFTVVLLTFVGACAWEIRCRAWGYRPTLNDTRDLWAERREAVKPDSVVIVGDSRAHYDMDLDELERGLGQRPIQLAIDGSCAFPVLNDLANDTSFHGTVICSVVPLMWLIPGGPAVSKSNDAIARYYRRTLAQRSGHWLGMHAEEHIAFLNDMDLSLGALLEKIHLPNRPGTGAPPLPGYFSTIDHERRARMIEQCAQPGPLQERIKHGWIPLFTAPPPPSYVPPEVFQARMAQVTEARFIATAAAVSKLREHGGRVVFVRFPSGGELKKFEDAHSPRAGIWTRVLKDTRAPGIYFEDYAELSGFNLPEWSHLSAPDSVEFTKRLVPRLKAALALAGEPDAALPQKVAGYSPSR
jgi:hypothetical protein